MLGRLAKRTIALAAILMCLTGLAGPVLAEPAYVATGENGYVQIVGSGSAAYNYTFHVERPYAVGLDADYWNLTVYADATGTTATNTTYYVHVYINDGNGHNISKNVTVAAKNNVRVYGNVSFAAADWASLTINDSGIYYVDLEPCWRRSCGICSAALDL